MKRARHGKLLANLHGHRGLDGGHRGQRHLKVYAGLVVQQVVLDLQFHFNPVRTGVRERLGEAEAAKLAGSDGVDDSPINDYLQLTARNAGAGLLREPSAESSLVIHRDPCWAGQFDAGAGED